MSDRGCSTRPMAARTATPKISARRYQRDGSWDDPATLFQMSVVHGGLSNHSSASLYRPQPWFQTADRRRHRSCHCYSRAAVTGAWRGIAKCASSNTANLRGYQGSYQGSRGAGWLHHCLSWMLHQLPPLSLCPPRPRLPARSCALQ